MSSKGTQPHTRLCPFSPKSSMPPAVGASHLSIHTAPLLTCIPSSQGQRLNLHLHFRSVSQPAAAPVPGSPGTCLGLAHGDPSSPRLPPPSPAVTWGLTLPLSGACPGTCKSSSWAELLSPDPKPELYVSDINLWELREQFSHEHSSSTNYTERGFPGTEETGRLPSMGSQESDTP